MLASFHLGSDAAQIIVSFYRQRARTNNDIEPILKVRTVEDISKVFAKLVFQGKLSAAIELLDSESSTGFLNLPPEVLEGL